MKKVLLLASVIVALTSCGGGASDKPADSTATKDSAVSTPAPADTTAVADTTAKADTAATK